MSSLLWVPAALAAVIAVVTDVHGRRIPNWLTASTFAVGLVGNVWLAGIPGGVSAVGGAALGFALLLPFYVLRVVGAGDVKLLAALGAVLGARLLVSAALYGAVVGGLMSLGVLALTGRLQLALFQIVVQHVRPSASGARAPYGVAIAAGACLAMLLAAVSGGV